MLRRLRFALERWLLRGAAHRLATIAAAIATVSLCGGLAVLPLGEADLATFPDAVWWAFLRLTDPGYLGDDTGIWRRLVSTGVTIGGYVLFMGALIAVMTQALDATISRLERGETSISVKGHLLVVGWTDRSAAIIRQFLLSQQRTKRFLERRGAELHIVLLVEELSPVMQAEIQARFAELWDDTMITLRSGSMLRVEHLERVAFADAAAIVLPGADAEADAAKSDIAVIKTLLSIASHPAIAAREHPPRVVAEVFDSRKVVLAREAYPGDLDVIPSDLQISRLIVQNLRNPGLSHVYGELLTHNTGAEVYVRQKHGLEGVRIDEAAGRFDRAILLGVVRLEEGVQRPLLSPPGDLIIQQEDRLVFVAASFEATAPRLVGDARPIETIDVLREEPRTRRVLVLGWSEKLAPMLSEMGTYRSEQWEVTVFSLVPEDERTRYLDTVVGPVERVEVAHATGEFTLPGAMRSIAPETYDHVVLLGSDWLASDEEADARTLVGYLTLRIALKDAVDPPHVLVEITDPGNAGLFDVQRGEIVVSPLIISNLLAHVTLRAEVLPVFDALFSAGGPSLWFRKAVDYGLVGEVSFTQIALAVRRRGHVAVGVRRDTKRSSDPVDLIPHGDDRFDCAIVDLVVMAPSDFGGL